MWGGVCPGLGGGGVGRWWGVLVLCPTRWNCTVLASCIGGGDGFGS